MIKRTGEPAYESYPNIERFPCLKKYYLAQGENFRCSGSTT